MTNHYRTALEEVSALVLGFCADSSDKDSAATMTKRESKLVGLIGMTCRDALIVGAREEPTTFLLIGYRSDGEDTCRGQVMERSSSDLVLEANLSIDAAVLRAAELLGYEGLGSYDVTIVDSNGVVRFCHGSDSCSSWCESDDEDSLFDAVNAALAGIHQARIDAKAAEANQARIDAEAQAQRDLEASEERDRQEFIRLGLKFRGVR